MLWDLLVTDGHVQAARIRWIQPWLIAAALFLIVFSVFLAVAVRGATAINNSAFIMPDIDAAAPVSTAIAGLPALAPMENEGKTLPLFKDIDLIVVPTLLEELNKNGQLTKLNPKDYPDKPTVEVAHLSAEDFWRKPWPHTQLVGVQKDDVAIVGAIANQGSADFVMPVRWLGVYRKHKGQWEFISANNPPFTPDPLKPSAPLQAIPLTLEPVLPSQE